MQEVTQNNSGTIWKEPVYLWGMLALCILLLGFIFADGLAFMVKKWNGQEEYSHGFMIPLISLFFIWQKKNELERIPFQGSWLGLVILLMGLGLYFVGELSTLYIIVQYAFLISLYGVVLTWLGWRGTMKIWMPLVLLVFMIPLPLFLYQGLSANLQLISSQLGVWVIRLFDISVYLEGNVIDLGSYKLQVVEACSGLRYLFPLMTLGFIAAYLFQGALWKRLVIFLSTIPITVLMNSFRIGVIGVLVEYWGQSMAEGFLHDFEGWVIFMACTAILILEMWALNKIGRDKRPLRDVFGLEFPEPSPKDAEVLLRKLPGSFIASGVALTVALISASSLDQRSEIVPQRMAFSQFPMEIGGWRGKGGRLEQIYLRSLKLDDYIIADFVDEAGSIVNFYAAYYASQSKGQSTHSPRTCLPGGGWMISDLSEKSFDGVQIGNAPLKVNRVVIKKGDYKQLVYYWFQGRERILTNEYVVKWYLLWDALTRNRTDGALVRLTTMVRPGEELADADRKLSGFLKQISDSLTAFIPD